ncbi:hypothetical protein ACIGHG_24600 [Bacillus sp. NPDC077411]|uniref:Group-specific protein n=1 Tax=Bacillus bruguierae TaxID=3127667 RepID=A0ABU8FP02_9BACI|nr:MULTISPECIES: hypothetical protein [unclassified Bacillus (in: firmicutes)]SFJ94616.1 hypothetical protein SAMN04488574_13632 [Bacillus sp. 71mf]SFS99596.1 hypothetical protein SAMN04488145_106193 [Bacillus sp. 103mf]
MEKEDGKFAFKIFLIALCLFVIYLFISFIFSMYIPYIDLLLLVGFVWAFVEARECEDSIYRRITLGGTAFILIVYIAMMHDVWKQGFIWI